jgi:hypothetical protein
MTETAPKAEVAASPDASSLGYLSMICFLAWLIPGLGHFLLRRLRHGVIFMICIIFLFFWGLNLGAKIYQYEPQQPLTFFAMVAQWGMGLPYFLARMIASYARVHPQSMLYGFAENFHFGEGYIENVTFEYGNTFAIVAGLLNFLVILDAYDIAVGRKNRAHA